MKVSCVLLVNDPCRQLQDRFTPPARPWFASGGGHMSWKPFVVGVDASPEAAGAAAFACRVAEQAGAGCRLVHATRDVLAAFEVPEVAAYRRAIVEQARGRVTAALSGRVPPKTLDEMIVRLGAPAMALKQAVAEVDAEIVVLGGKHHSTLGRWLGGSTSLNVARTTEVPLLVTAGAPMAIHRVLVAGDLSGAPPPAPAGTQRASAAFGEGPRAVCGFWAPAGRPPGPR